MALSLSFLTMSDLTTKVSHMSQDVPNMSVKCPQDICKMSLGCPQDVVERILESINGLSENLKKLF